MRILRFVSLMIFCGVLALAQSSGNSANNSTGNTNSNNGGGQTSSPGSGQPGTGNIPGTGTGQGTGGDITTTPKATRKKHKSSRKKDRNPKTGASCANPDRKDRGAPK